MAGNVFRDYINSFRWGRIKEVFGNFFWWIALYGLIIYPLMIAQLQKDNLISYYGSVIPAYFIGFCISVTEMRLPKIMLLCPMNREERKKYLYLMSAARIFVPMAPGLILYGIGCYWIKASPICCAVGVFSMFSFSLCASLSTSFKGSGFKYGKRREERPEQLKGLEPVGLTGVGIGILLLAGSIALMNVETLLWLDYVWGAAAVLELILDILAFGYIGPVVEIAAGGSL